MRRFVLTLAAVAGVIQSARSDDDYSKLPPNEMRKFLRKEAETEKLEDLVKSLDVIRRFRVATDIHEQVVRAVIAEKIAELRNQVKTADGRQGAGAKTPPVDPAALVEKKAGKPAPDGNKLMLKAIAEKKGELEHEALLLATRAEKSGDDDALAMTGVCKTLIGFLEQIEAKLKKESGGTAQPVRNR